MEERLATGSIVLGDLVGVGVYGEGSFSGSFFFGL